MFRNALAFATLLACLAPVAYGQTDSAQTAAGEATGESPESELRKPRAWALSGEIGINSLSSLVGLAATFYVNPRFPVDVGLGLSQNGLRPGVRARYLFSADKVAYFAGAGVKYGLGAGDTEIKVDDVETKEKLGITLDPTGFVDAMLGVEYLADNGFLVIANAGYSQMLGGKNWHVASGTASDKSVKTFDTIFGSGIMLSVSLGKAF
jgi:hypothetical protein